MNCLTSNVNQTLMMLKVSSLCKISRPSFSTPNFRKTGSELVLVDPRVLGREPKHKGVYKPGKQV